MARLFSWGLLCLGLVAIGVHGYCAPTVYTEADGIQIEEPDEFEVSEAEIRPVDIKSVNRDLGHWELRIGYWCGNGRVWHCSGRVWLRDHSGKKVFQKDFSGWQQDVDWGSVFALSIADIDLDGMEEVLLAEQTGDWPDDGGDTKWASVASDVVVYRWNGDQFQPIVQRALPWHARLLASCVGRQLTTTVNSLDPVRGLIYVALISAGAVANLHRLWRAMRGRRAAEAKLTIWLLVGLAATSQFLVADKLSYAPLLGSALIIAAVATQLGMACKDRAHRYEGA